MLGELIEVAVKLTLVVLLVVAWAAWLMIRALVWVVVVTFALIGLSLARRRERKLELVERRRLGL